MLPCEFSTNVDPLPLPIQLLIFSVAAAVVWRAGTALSNTTDVLCKRFKLGEALGGIIVLAIVTNLPQIAITISAALNGQVELRVGNILGVLPWKPSYWCCSTLLA